MTMNNRAGFWRENFRGELAYKSFVPAPLPPNPVVELSNRGLNKLIMAHSALAALDAVANRVPNIDLFIAMYVRKEAVLSSQIEGTRCTLEDILDPFVESNANQDVEDVVNYIRATRFAFDRLASLPLCNRFVREVHKVLLAGVRGQEKLPGEFRTSQNWLGGNGSNLRTARYIPPNVEDMQVALSNWERYIHEADDIDALVRVALLHYQFETIHPFLDGNGRIGRLFIILFLQEKQVLSKPVLYISYYLKLNRVEYYDRMMEVRRTGDYEQWVVFFLEALAVAAQEAVQTIDALNALHQESMAAVLTYLPKRQLENAGKVFSYLESQPIIEIGKTAKALEMPYNSVARVVQELVTLGLVKQITKNGRSRIFAYSKYIEILKRE